MELEYMEPSQSLIESQPLNTNPRMISKKLLTALSVVVDVFIWIAVSVAGVVLAYNLTEMEPVYLGFFCDDQTLQYPYRPDSVKDSVVIIVSVLIPAVIMFFVESVHTCTERKTNVKIEKSNLWVLIISLYRVIGVFLAGGSGTILITEVLKLVSGRLRPHYFDVCEPDYKKINCSQGYIIPPLDFCNNTDTNILLDARKSFPSGHASISAYGAVFLLIFLQRRFIWRRFKLVPPLVQMCVFCVGIYISISRVTDNKHHVTDVIGGAVIGVVVAVFMVICVWDVSTKHTDDPQRATFSDDSYNDRQTSDTYPTLEIKHRNNIYNTESNIPNV